MTDPVLTKSLAAFLDSNRVGVLATEASDGHPRQSLVYFVRDGDALCVSTLAERLKVTDVDRTGWASLCVMGHERPFPSATFSGPAEILNKDIGSVTARIMQRLADLPERPEPQSDEALAAVGRVILRIAIENVTSVNYVDDAG